MFRIEYPYLDMKKIADSGQIFRFNVYDDEFSLVAGDKLLFIKEDKNGYILSCSEKEFNEFWLDYFDLRLDYGDFEKNIPETDIFLKDAAKYSYGIRILNQDKWEMLISFIISQRKSIPAIKSSIEKLAKVYGKKIDMKIPEFIKNIDADTEFYTFPTPKEFANADIEALNACSLGYRSPYIEASAKAVYRKDIDLNAIDSLDDEELLKALMSLKGVGIKVANCVALFGYHRIAAFPIDVWIKRMIDEHYDGEFPLELYKGYAGVIQQYIFYYGRESAKHSSN
ncbi:DNA-3-methyladenine glycosylase 2 family protein [Lachnoanaerobaculum sp. Marseille-Q4761]|jgi:putative DNA glycosylase (DNA repair protein)|uniref:DNA-3-methyladenine glycosylase family protein n=1 Tax=Lachnoanaerobaculum sp. Marseille-Q4761 TaxID=2819511 RepID=UPI001AA19079|nr:DNA-3-methyladenine glycosylase 2 family protein [Lachnoanaerobaculum sp. Marseille-Q4761]MBO1871193.1 DNA-3-methyladenine glycosylase 2 family protein [Lachnoanaerobaculum sp. Marseille-Q4761]